MKPGRPFNRTQPLGQIMWREGWSVADLEHVTHISYTTLSKYLSGKKRMSSVHLSKLAVALDVEPEELEVRDVADTDE